MPESYPSIGEAVGAAMAHNITLAHSELTDVAATDHRHPDDRTGLRPASSAPRDLPYTAEDVQRAAAGICAQSLYRLDHPSGTGEALEGRTIPSFDAAARRPTHWSDLPIEDFTAVADQLHRLITDAADHTSLATSTTQPLALLPASLDQLLPPNVNRVTGTDVRAAAICLAHDLIEEDLRDGPIFSSVLDEPIASKLTLDGPAPAWGQLPARQLIPALRLIQQSVEQAQHRIGIAVDAAIHASAPSTLPSTAAAANSRSPAADRIPSTSTPPPPSPPPAPGSTTGRRTR